MAATADHAAECFEAVVGQPTAKQQGKAPRPVDPEVALFAGQIARAHAATGGDGADDAIKADGAGGRGGAITSSQATGEARSSDSAR